MVSLKRILTGLLAIILNPFIVTTLQLCVYLQLIITGLFIYPVLGFISYYKIDHQPQNDAVLNKLFFTSIYTLAALIGNVISIVIYGVKVAIGSLFEIISTFLHIPFFQGLANIINAYKNLFKDMYKDSKENFLTDWGNPREYTPPPSPVSYRFESLEIDSPNIRPLTEQEIAQIPQTGPIRDTYERLLDLERNLDMCVITLTPIQELDDPILVFEGYPNPINPDEWQFVPGTHRIFSKDALLRWLLQRPIHPSTREFFYREDTHQYRWYTYRHREGVSYEAVPCIQAIREGLAAFEFDDESLTENNSIASDTQSIANLLVCYGTFSATPNTASENESQASNDSEASIQVTWFDLLSRHFPKFL